MNRLRGAPAFVKVAGLCVVFCLLTTLGIALAWRHIRNHDDRAVCMRQVAAREDNRAMWDFLIANLADPANPKVPPFRAELNKRLPHLKCDSRNHLTPVEAP